MFTFTPLTIEFNGADKPEEENYETFEGFLQSPMMRNHAAGKGFDSFVKSDNLIMLILNDGFIWWVLGTVTGGEIPLPEWDHGKYRIIVDGESVVKMGTEVQSSCGSVVTLKDGKAYKRDE